MTGSAGSSRNRFRRNHEKGVKCGWPHRQSTCWDFWKMSRDWSFAMRVAAWLSLVKCIVGHGHAEFEKLNFDGTHNLNLPAVLGLAAELCILPADVVVWTVEAEYVGPGEPVSPKVAAAAAKVADRIWSELTHA